MVATSSETAGVPTGVGRVAGVVGGLAIAAAVGFSGLLAYGSLPGMTAPGCGAEAACGKLAESALGTLFGLWSSAFLGVAYFAAIGSAWVAVGSRSLPGAMAWIVRLGFLGSVGYLAAMAQSGELCLYCLGSHVANLVLLIAVEVRRRAEGAPAGNAWFFSFVGAFVLVSAGLGVADRVMQAEENEQLDQEIANDVANLTGGGGTGTPDEGGGTDTQGPADDAGSETGTDGQAVEVLLTDAARARILEIAGLPSNEVSGPGREGFTGEYLMGPERARARVVMFSNPYCPSCRKVHKEVVDLMRNRDDISLSIKHFPLDPACNPMVAAGRGHSGACTIARIMEAVGMIAGPEGYWAITEWLYETMERSDGRINIGQVYMQAERLGIDQRTLRETINDPRIDAVIASDVEEGMAAGLTQTPFVVVNGNVVRSWTRVGDLTNTLRQALASPNLVAGDSSGDSIGGAIENIVGDWRDGRRVSVQPSTHGHAVIVGPAGAPATEVVLFGDYAQADTRTVDGLIRDRAASGLAMTYSFRFFPLAEACNSVIRATQNPQACDMAYVVVRAGEMGGREAFAQMHEAMMTIDPAIDRAVIEEAFSGIGLDPQAALSQIASQTTRGAVSRDTSAHRAIGMNAAPLLLIDGRRVKWRDLDELGEILDRIFDETGR